MKRAHVITCLDEDEYYYFIENGFAGLYPIKVARDKIGNIRAYAAKIGTNWDVIADLKRVKPEDLIFIHIKGEGYIYGPFEATSYFLESEDMTTCFKSENLNIDFWTEHYEYCEFEDYPWRVSIKSIDGLTGEIGFDAKELFKLKAFGFVQSLPDRFLYHDKPKIVKPLLTNETELILDFLKKVNTESALGVQPMNLENFSKIKLNLKPHNTGVYREKILEAWLMENVTNNGDNIAAHQNVIEIFGKRQHFANSIFTYYTNFLDILLYDTAENNIEVCPNCLKYTSKNKNNIFITELKTGWADINAYKQVREYGEWALKVLANNQPNKLTLSIVATGFSDEIFEKNDVSLIKYQLIEEEPFLKLSNARNG